MEQELHDFLDSILNDYPTCFSQDCKDTDINMYPDQDDLFFCINGLKHARSDANVIEYRNFLIEIDSMPLEEQIDYVKSIVPVTSVVYSGGKSYHFIISLDVPASSLVEYREIADRILTLLPAADKSCRNPSRFSRLPFRLRKETGKNQALKEYNGKVSKQELLSLLPPPPPVSSVLSTNTRAEKSFISVTLNYAMELPDQFMQERGFAGRNHFFFYLYNRLKDEGLGQSDIRHYIEHTYGNLKNRTGFELKEALSAARIY